MSNSNHIITYRFERIRKNGNGHDIIGKRMHHETGATAREGEFAHPVSYVMLRNDNRYLLRRNSICHVDLPPVPQNLFINSQGFSGTFLL